MKDTMIRFYIRTIIYLLILQANAAFGVEGFSIEQILSAPRPSNLVASPKDSKFAWVFNDKGVVNIWIAEAPEYHGRQVTDYREDDGQRITDLRFTPDGNRLIYARGGNTNLIHPEVSIQGVWTVPAMGGDPHLLSEGNSPRVSPDGSKVVLIKNGQVWITSFEEDARAKQLFEIRGGAWRLRWSPNVSHPKLAFQADRDDHGYICIYDFDTHKLRYLEPSVDWDTYPVWSPSGQEIAYIRRVAQQGVDRWFARMRSGIPWSIRIADVTSGKGRQVWVASEGAGSVFKYVSAENQLLWGSGNRLVFPWQVDGWIHLYSISLQGGDPILLTPGKFDVNYVSMTPDGREILFSSNQNDIDRHHIWRVAITGEPAQAVTSGKGIEWEPVMTTSDRTIALIGSDARHPAHPYRLMESGKLRSLAPETIPDDFPSDNLVEPESVIFAAADGLEIHGQLFLPPEHNPEFRYPAILFFHGGPGPQMLMGFNIRWYYHNAYALNQFLANHGYIVLSVNWRGGSGYGRAFREAPDMGPSGASEFNDVLGAGIYLHGRSDVDQERIGLWGGSYGGILTAMGLSRASDLFRAGVAFSGRYDWRTQWTFQKWVSSYDASTREELMSVAFQSSPMSSVNSWRSPVLLIHGDDDQTAPFSETVNLIKALREQNVYFEQLIFPDESHGFLLHLNWVTAYEATYDFFERMLKSKQPLTIP